MVKEITCSEVQTPFAVKRLTGASKIGERVELTLPYPPTANHIWRSGSGNVYKSAQYRQFERDVAAAHLEQGAPFISGPYGMTIVAVAPDRRRRDISNLIKPIEDVLNKRAIEDDHFCKVITACWFHGEIPSKENARVVVSIAALELIK